MFEQPYFVSQHAVTRFRERIANLPTKTIRSIIQAALQDNRQTVIIQNWNKRQCPVFRARYRDIEYFIPVVNDSKEDAWPAVPTILLSEMEIKSLYAKRGWKWN